MDIDKKSLSEQDICSKFITPAITGAGWSLMHQVREQVTFTDGQIIVRGKTINRGEKKRADYILYYKPNIPIAIVEAKDNKHAVGAGMQQAKDYAKALDIPFVFSSNGDGFVFHDGTGQSLELERTLSINEFPSPEVLFEKYQIYKNWTPEQTEIINEPYYYTPNGKTPRYYQEVAINRAIDSVVKGQNRILLTMATGTGKTYTAFQIMWRLWKARQKKRILFLADRNILVDDPLRRDFSPFKDKMVKLKRHNFDISKATSYEIFVGIYQSATGTEEYQQIFRQFKPDFFDLIVIDECHRGSAADDSAWREILSYFKTATQIGMTATPKETKSVSNSEYFGDPIYTYSLKQGIADGFLAPYKVIRVTIDKDVEGYRPELGKKDKFGNEIPDEEYNQKDFGRRLFIDERDRLVARKITEFLKLNDRFSKTIVFCMTIDHAEILRQALVNENQDLVLENSKYVMRITGDSEEGKNELDNFIDPEKRYPVIATTSKLLTTGVDAKTCKLIVLDSNINSMTEFKQIIGRGTRIDSEFDKYYFTIMDFRQATTLFADPGFDGEPVRIKEIGVDEPLPGEEEEETEGGDEGGGNGPIESDPPSGPVIIDIFPPIEGQKKYFINGVNVNVINETVQYYNEKGKLTTESVKEYSKKNIISRFRTLDEFVNSWSKADQKTAIINELESHGVLFDELKREVGKDLDPFDMVLHIAYQKPALTRKERALQVQKRNYFVKYGEKAKQVLEAILEKYADQGIKAIENIEVLKVAPIEQYGTPLEIVGYFGGKDQYISAINEMKQVIYMSNNN